MRSSSLAASALVLLACGHAPAPLALSSPAEPAASEEGDVATFALRWLPGEASVDPTVEVRFELDLRFVEPAPTSVTLFFAPLELGDAESSGTRFLEADAPAIVSVSEGTATWPVVDGFARGTHRVRLEHARHDPVRGIDNVPHATRGGWTVPGVALFPTILRLDDGRSVDGAARLTTQLPEGWSHHHSAASRDAMHVESFSELAWAVHAFGTYRLEELEHGAVRVRFVSADYDASALEPLRSLVRRALTQGEAWLGPLPPGELTLVIDRVGGEYEGGLVGAHGIVLSGPDLGSLRAHEMPGLVVVHELMHFWARADEPWLNEGLARLLEIEVGGAVEGLDGEASIAELRERVDRYHALAGATRSVRSDSAGAWPYESGLATLLCVEAELRPRGQSLLAVHRALRERDGLPVRVAAFRAALEERVPGLGAQLDGWLAHEGPIALAPCLRALGIGAEPTTSRVPSARTLVVLVLHARGIDTTQMRVTAVSDASLLREGDVILRLDDARVSTLDTLAWALRDAEPGHAFTLHVERGGEPVALAMTMPRLPAEAFVEVPAIALSAGEAGGRTLDRE